MGTALESLPLGPIFGTILAGVLLALSWADLRSFRLPDVMTFPLIALGLLWSALGGTLAAAMIGAALGYGAFVAIAWAFKRLRGIDGLGRGDAKLLAAGGAWCGWAALPMIVLIASLAGIIFALISAARPNENAAAERVPANWIPFGPCLAAAIFALWCAQQLAPSAF